MDSVNSKEILEEWANAFKMRKWFSEIKMTIAEDVKDQIPTKVEQDGWNELNEEQKSAI